jgi:hypothetical protein
MSHVAYEFALGLYRLATSSLALMFGLVWVEASVLGPNSKLYFYLIWAVK